MFRKRLITGTVFAVVTAFAFFLPGKSGAVLFSLLAVSLIFVAMHEYEQLTERLGCPVFSHLLPVFGVLLVLAVVLPPLSGVPEKSGPELLGAAELLLLFLFLVAATAATFRMNDLRRGMARLAFTVMGLALIYGTLSFIPKLYFAEGLGWGGRLLALFLLAVTKCSDIGAYALGSLTARRPQGNHKIIPRLSPGKSWEGLAGGVLASATAALFLLVLTGGQIVLGGVKVLGFGSAMLMGVSFAIAGFLGDLTESVLKRAAGVKDSGSVPGLGGVLDMTDSLIFTAPLFCAYIYLVRLL